MTKCFSNIKINQLISVIQRGKVLRNILQYSVYKLHMWMFLGKFQGEKANQQEMYPGFLFFFFFSSWMWGRKYPAVSEILQTSVTLWDILFQISQNRFFLWAREKDSKRREYYQMHRVKFCFEDDSNLPSIHAKVK